MYYAPMCCHAYLSIICYQMTVMKAVILSMITAAQTIAIPTGSENSQHVDNLQQQNENEESFQWKSCCC